MDKGKIYKAAEMMVILVILESVIFVWYNDTCTGIKFGYFGVLKSLPTTVVEKYAEDSFSLSLFLKGVVKLRRIHSI